MAYLRRWRKCHAEAAAIALGSSSSEDEASEVQIEERRDIERESTSSSSDGHALTTDSNTSDNDIDFGFSDTVESSDSASVRSLSENEDEKTFRENIASWATKNNMRKSSVDDLLKILRHEGHEELPKDARSLLQTPKKVECEDRCGGKYIYFGISSGIKRILDCVCVKDSISHISLNFNIDGVPLFKSSGSQFWPILCSFGSFRPFIVALFNGYAKPNSLPDFLSDFLREMSELKQNGITFKEKNYPITVNAFICDAPARAFLKNIKGHTGYNSCERCTLRGCWKDNRVVLYQSNEECPLRTDENFSAGVYTAHQLGPTPLVDFDVSCVKSFSLDYMHLVCLGVVKRLLWFLRQGPSECKLSHRQISQISENLLRYTGKLPTEFARQPRTMFEIERWKATEFRQFLLYTGPVVLKKVLSKELYDHFVTLAVAISVLLESDSNKRSAYIDYAENLLRYFVNKSKELYTEKFISYNVHNLVHKADDARYFNSSLNEISAFPYENHLHSIKKLVRNAKNPIIHVTKRLMEKEMSETSNLEVQTMFTHISTKQRNSCFLLRNESYAFVKEKRQDGKLVCDVLHQNKTENFFYCSM